MDWQQLILSAIVGGVIGYITNWIAIKMLFRPLFAKYILGIRVPFTPGVIPKEKGRLARSIADAVSSHLLTSKHISQQLLTAEAEEKLCLFIRNELSGAKDKTVGEVASGVGIEEGARDKWLEKIRVLALKSARNESTQTFLAARLAEDIQSFLKNHPAELIKKNEYKSFKKSIISFLIKEENKEHFKRSFKNKIETASASTYTFREVIPEPLLNGIREYLVKLGPRIIIVIEEYLNSQKTRELLVERIESFFERSLVRRFMGNVLGFMGKDTRQIADKVVKEVAEFFSGQENRELLLEKIEDTMEYFMNLRVCDLVEWVDADTREKIIQETGEYFAKNILSEQVLDKIFERVEAALEDSGVTWDELLDVEEEKIERNLKIIFEKISLSRNFEKHLEKILHHLGQSFFHAGVADLLPSVNNEKTQQLEQKILEYYRSFVKHYLPGVLDFVDINNLIRQRVDDLEIWQVEELVLHIMRKELVAITWLGAILGAIIGITMVTMQTLGQL